MLANKCYLIIFPEMYITPRHAHLIHHTHHLSKSRRYLMLLDICMQYNLHIK
jgi:hypothetical protein